MNSPFVSLAAATQNPLFGGAGQGAAVSGGPAFLAILDHMLGLVSAGAGQPADTRAAGTTPFQAPNAQDLPSWLLAQSANTPAIPSATAVVDESGRPDGDANPEPTPAKEDLSYEVSALLAAATGAAQPQGENTPQPADQTTRSIQAGQAADAERLGRFRGLAGLVRDVTTKDSGQVTDSSPEDAGKAERIDAKAIANANPLSASLRGRPAAVAANAIAVVADGPADLDLAGLLATVARRPNQPPGRATVQAGTVRADGEAGSVAKATEALTPPIAPRQPAGGPAKSRSRDANEPDGRQEISKAPEAPRPERAQGTEQTPARATPPLVLAAGTAGDDQQSAKAAVPANTHLPVSDVGGSETSGLGRLIPAVQTASAPTATGIAAGPDVNRLALHIASQSDSGKHRFEIELDPPELGRVEVRLEFARDGRVTTHLLVDRNDTLDALMRDARGLERALQAHGLKLEDGGVQYQLRDQSAFAQHHRDNPNGRNDHSPSDNPVELPTADTEQVTERRRLALGGLDLMI